MENAKDYYKVLGVSKTATPDEIKKAFRRLAMKYHPDKNKGDRAAEERFKEINEAYAVLSDPEKKKQYDTFGSSEFNRRYTQEDIFRNFDFGDIFQEFGIGGKGGARAWRVSFGGRPGGVGSFDDLISQIFSQGTGGVGEGYEKADRFASARPGEDITLEIPLSPREMSEGCEKRLAFDAGGLEERISVKIPPGVGPGKKIRVAGKGGVGAGGIRGDLYLVVRPQVDSRFRVNGLDLEIDQPISFSSACLGGEIEVPTAFGGSVRLKIPPGTGPGKKLRIKGKGLPDGKGGSGNQYVRLMVDVPKRLTVAQKELVLKLQNEGL
ncbi:DnaJ C-terminal domain-containing protein [Dissulfurimicrobium hydrothermale]|uniref:DnaJ C-terminal domain-containing protein n=1 Tax=Dissulfurimicrobium hydrothermale TaxID=1750598 RepID=UPI001EDB7099|nr:J domain-containing protein [Dissulfurimicrobium hydrothermale]UKL14472.1 J domain-containing protein [Dissulfurimicrobium hydrothermale]